MKNITKQLIIVAIIANFASCESRDSIRKMFCFEEKVSEKKIGINECIPIEGYLKKTNIEKRNYLEYIKESNIAQAYIYKIENYNDEKSKIFKNAIYICNYFEKEYKISLPNSIKEILKKYLEIKKNNEHLRYINSLHSSIIKGLLNNIYKPKINMMFLNNDIIELDYLTPILEITDYYIELFTRPKLYRKSNKILTTIVQKSICKDFSCSLLYEQCCYNNCKGLKKLIEKKYPSLVNEVIQSGNLKEDSLIKITLILNSFKRYIKNPKNDLKNLKKEKFSFFDPIYEDTLYICHLAIKNQNFDLFKKIFELMPDKILEITSDKNLSVLDIAVAENQIEVINFLGKDKNLAKKLNELSPNALCNYINSSENFHELYAVESLIDDFGYDINLKIDNKPLYKIHLEKELRIDEDIEVLNVWFEYIQKYIEDFNADACYIFDLQDNLLISKVRTSYRSSYKKKYNKEPILLKIIEFYCNKKQLEQWERELLKEKV